MSTVLSRNDIPDMWGLNAKIGLTNLEHTEHDKIAIAHMLKYCDSNKCIRGSAFVVSPMNKGWHEGVCLECAFNPYNMKKSHQPKGGGEE